MPEKLLVEMLRTQEISEYTKKEVQLTKKDIRELGEKLDIDKIVLDKVLEEGFRLPVPYEVTILNKVIEDIYTLARINKRKPHQIVNALSLDEKIKEILHEGVEEHTAYQHAIQLAGQKTLPGEWSNFLSGGILVSSSVILSHYAFFVLGWPAISAIAVGMIGGTITGLSAKAIGRKVEMWYNEQHRRYTQYVKKLEAEYKLDEGMERLQKRLSDYILNNGKKV